MSVMIQDSYYKSFFGNRNINFNVGTNPAPTPSSGTPLLWGEDFVQSATGRGAVTMGSSHRDKLGNTIAGLPSTNMLVPLGTYLGWNVRKAGFSEGDSCDLTGAYVPFFRTLAERQAANDPRPSLQERYPTHADYLAKVTAAAQWLVNRRLLRAEDAAFLVNQANGAAVP